MKVQRFPQQQRFIAVSLVLAFACAIPLLVAVERTKPGSGDTWRGWAWVENAGFRESGNMTITTSRHDWGIWNTLEDDDIECTWRHSHKVTKQGVGGLWEDMTRSGTITVPAGAYVTSSGPGTTTGDWPTQPGTYTFSAYTSIRVRHNNRWDGDADTKSLTQTYTTPQPG